MGQFFRTATGKIALGSLMTALSLILLMAACVMPTGQLGMTALAGIGPLICGLSGGISTGRNCWLASAVLGLLLLPNKGIAMLYALFLGPYPVLLKRRIEAIRKLMLEWALKLLACNIMLAGVLVVWRALFVPMLPAWSIYILFVMGNVVFIIYDIGLSQAIGVLRARLRL